MRPYGYKIKVQVTAVARPRNQISKYIRYLNRRNPSGLRLFLCSGSIACGDAPSGFRDKYEHIKT